MKLIFCASNDTVRCIDGRVELSKSQKKVSILRKTDKKSYDTDVLCKNQDFTAYDIYSNFVAPAITHVCMGEKFNVLLSAPSSSLFHKLVFSQDDSLLISALNDVFHILGANESSMVDHSVYLSATLLIPKKSVLKEEIIDIIAYINEVMPPSTSSSRHYPFPNKQAGALSPSSRPNLISTPTRGVCIRNTMSQRINDIYEVSTLQNRIFSAIPGILASMPPSGGSKPSLSDCHLVFNVEVCATSPDSGFSLSSAKRLTKVDIPTSQARIGVFRIITMAQTSSQIFSSSIRSLYEGGVSSASSIVSSKDRGMSFSYSPASPTPFLPRMSRMAQLLPSNNPLIFFLGCTRESVCTSIGECLKMRQTRGGVEEEENAIFSTISPYVPPLFSSTTSHASGGSDRKISGHSSSMVGKSRSMAKEKNRNADSLRMSHLSTIEPQTQTTGGTSSHIRHSHHQGKPYHTYPHSSSSSSQSSLRHDLSESRLESDIKQGAKRDIEREVWFTEEAKQHRGYAQSTSTASTGKKYQKKSNHLSPSMGVHGGRSGTQSRPQGRGIDGTSTGGFRSSAQGTINAKGITSSSSSSGAFLPRSSSTPSQLMTSASVQSMSQSKIKNLQKQLQKRTAELIVTSDENKQLKRRLESVLADFTALEEKQKGTVWLVKKMERDKKKDQESLLKEREVRKQEKERDAEILEKLEQTCKHHASQLQIVKRQHVQKQHQIIEQLRLESEEKERKIHEAHQIVLEEHRQPLHPLPTPTPMPIAKMCSFSQVSPERLRIEEEVRERECREDERQKARKREEERKRSEEILREEERKREEEKMLQTLKQREKEAEERDAERSDFLSVNQALRAALENERQQRKESEGREAELRKDLLKKSNEYDSVFKRNKVLISTISELRKQLKETTETLNALGRAKE
ncbi:hypothetical protein ADUPG1_011196 [Aduncisulcus paluster]|uniref:Uncharacterized protein n=1 Tax=Aduncisulcus paluster TaxID=2918883 RepID=A0ABQ5JXC6_9EUKA|nr:hypothetical protein ADUPG1_011196 [Aduncisulcus paluster]